MLRLWVSDAVVVFEEDSGIGGAVRSAAEDEADERDGASRTGSTSNPCKFFCSNSSYSVTNGDE